MKISEKEIKILFILFINVVLLIPFLKYLTIYYRQSYVIIQKNLAIVDTLSFKNVSNEIKTVVKNQSRRIEMTGTNGKQFRIWNTSIDAIQDKVDFFIKARNPYSKIIVYSDKKSAKMYKTGSSLFTTIRQIEIGNVKYIDLDKVNSAEKSIRLRYVFICPILALLLTLFFRHKLLKQT